MTVPAGTGALEATQQQVLTALQSGGTSSTSGLALESGGNLAAAKTDLDTIVTQTSGLATQTTLLAAKTDLDTIVTQTATPNVSDRWARQLGQIDIARVNGATFSQSNPVITESNIQNWIRNGQGFTGSTGLQSTAGAVNSTEFSLFNPSNSGKNILIYSLRVMTSTAQIGQVRSITTNPSLTAATVTNNAFAATSSVASVTYSNTTQSVVGSVLDVFDTNGIPMAELLTSGAVYLLPSGANNGIAVFINVSAAISIAYSAKWIEF